MSEAVIGYIPWAAAAATVLCALCAMKKSLRTWAGWISVAGTVAALILTLWAWQQLVGQHELVRGVRLWSWIQVAGLDAGMSYLFDSLAFLMLVVVCGIGALVSIYACGYMAGDRGYARFFAFVSLFIFAMSSLVLADNLLLLYLGWEGVGLCSYLLIGYYYHRPSAVAAAKKAFIVNRVGDVGFALGIFLVFQRYESLSVSHVLQQAHLALQAGGTTDWRDLAIPFLLMLGAFGKSAQIPLYVWLPDAMEGPTPVSALIHAATMVTAGVYMIVRLLPIFALSPAALPTVAVVGGLTAFFAATIALCQYDLKRIYAYSTISQLGYMFLGVGVLSAGGAMFHLFTHAFFKALLFLTAGSVMHALAGQLDLRRISGLGRRMPVTAGLMLIGCLALAGFPLTAGFYSKDEILAAVLGRGLGEHGSGLFLSLGILALATAFLTALYTFRLWFRVFLGPAYWELGPEQHGPEEVLPGQGASGADSASGAEHSRHGEPHEVGWLMNGPLIILAAGSLLTGWLCKEWVHRLVGQAWWGLTAEPMHAQLWEWDVHQVVAVLSGGLAVLGIGLAAYFHWWNRDAARRLAEAYSWLVRILENKYWVDELYEAVVVRPLRALGTGLYVVDRLVIDGLVLLVGLVPRLVGLAVQPAQSGRLAGYAMGMVAGLAIVLAGVIWAMNR